MEITCKIRRHMINSSLMSNLICYCCEWLIRSIIR
ncbi:unnamed protein product [Schistosoma mattheei]|uniref:Uncharacterized protein n=1 Tax=Schistosoma mattheei TaxID=31246 RepID=A0A183Q0V2_9TREM|nr:unnamed protein product [Schistosoma mattheei]